MKCRVLEVARTALMPPEQRVHAHFCDWFSLYHATLVDGSLLFGFSVNLQSLECFYSVISPQTLYAFLLFLVFFLDQNQSNPNGHGAVGDKGHEPVLAPHH